MNGHQPITKDSEKLASIRDSAAGGRPVRWICVRFQATPAAPTLRGVIRPADQWAIVACVREVERLRLASTAGVPTGID